MAQVASAQQFPFVWEGTDKKGKRIKGKMLAVSEAAVKADLRRQGVLAKRVRKEMQLFKSGKKINCRGHRAVRAPARHDAAGGHPDGPVLRHHRQRSRQAVDAEAGAGDQRRRRGRHLAARGARQASAVLRRPVRQPGRSRRACRCAGNAARQGRDLQGKDRGAEEEDQEGAVLSRPRCWRSRSSSRSSC